MLVVVIPVVIFILMNIMADNISSSDGFSCSIALE